MDVDMWGVFPTTTMVHGPKPYSVGVEKIRNIVEWTCVSHRRMRESTVGADGTGRPRVLEEEVRP